MSLNFNGINIGGTNSGGGGGSVSNPWISTLYTIQSNAPAETEGRTYDISQGLPNDNNNYEVMLRAWATTGATNADSHIISIKSDFLENQAYVVQAVNFGGTKGTQTNTVIIPVGAQRELILIKYAANTGTYGMAIIAYKKM